MPISTKCPACGQPIAAPDSAAGHKAKCPKCGGVVPIPAASATAALAAALSVKAPVARGAAAPSAAAAVALKEAPAEAPPAAPESTPTPPSRGSQASTTTVDRMLARTSPYDALRLMAAVIFGVGVALAVVVLLGGLAALVMISTMLGQPLAAVGLFVGALALAVIFFVGAKTASGLVRLWADVGDRTRQMTQMLEEHITRMKDNGI